MNNEIKEILEKLKDREETYQFCKQYKLATNDWIYEAHYLLDYITNLQQENERLKENNSDMQEEMARTWEKCDDYKSRCEKAIEYNYELQERYCHSAIFDELVASKVYEITEKELNILQNGSDSQ